MIPRSTQRRLNDAIRRGLYPQSAEPYVPVETGDPDRPWANVNPTLRFRWMDVDVPDEPYTLVTMEITQSEVPDTRGASDERSGRVLDTSPAPDDADADVAVTRGRPVHDELSIMTTAQGSDTFDGRLPDGISAADRAEAVCDAVHDFLTERFSRASLDAFDSNGNAVDTDQQIYGEDLTPKILVSAPPGRGVTDTTEQVDASGAQFNAGVNLHYYETSVSYQYRPERVGTSTRIED